MRVPVMYAPVMRVPGLAMAALFVDLSFGRCHRFRNEKGGAINILAPLIVAYPWPIGMFFLTNLTNLRTTRRSSAEMAQQGAGSAAAS